jgi:hypothetical protein
MTADEIGHSWQMVNLGKKIAETKYIHREWCFQDISMLLIGALSIPCQGLTFVTWWAFFEERPAVSGINCSLQDMISLQV